MGSKSNKNKRINNDKAINNTKSNDIKNKTKKNVEKSKLNDIIKNKNFKWAVIFAVIIVAIVVVAEVYPYIAPFNAPASINPDTYYKVSNKDLLSNGSSAIFFVSWYGCPIGATNSWALYYAMNQTENISNDVSLHTATNDIYAYQPGLLFNKDIIFKSNGNKFTFYPLYLYNESMTGTINNVSIKNSNLVSYGLSKIKSNMPSGVYNLFVKYKSTIASGNPLHIATTIVITGPKGAYILNAFMYEPSSNGILGSGTYNDWSPHTPQYVMSNINGSKTITTAASTFSGYLNKVG